METRFVSNHPCEYLPGRMATLNYEYRRQLSPQQYEDLMNQGCRKFGRLVFQPSCGSCQECRPIRVPVDRFSPNRTQRRTLQRNADLELRFAPPTLDAARLDLYTRYHAFQSQQKGWPVKEADPEQYFFTFLNNPIPAVEISAWNGSALCAIALNDLTPNVVSAVYHYYDPEIAHRSLGTFVILQAIAVARKLRKPWLYLGFYVEGCSSMIYKASYRPCQIMDPNGVWLDT